MDSTEQQEKSHRCCIVMMKTTFRGHSLTQMKTKEIGANLLGKHIHASDVNFLKIKYLNMLFVYSCAHQLVHQMLET